MVVKPGRINPGRTRRIANSFLLVLVLLMGAGNLLATYMEVQSFKHSQQVQGQMVENKLCFSLHKLEYLKPPDRLYDLQLHTILSGLADDISCPPFNSHP